MLCVLCFFFNDTATTEIYTLSLHDALPISGPARPVRRAPCLAPPAPERAVTPAAPAAAGVARAPAAAAAAAVAAAARSEEHTSELQSRQYLVCRLLLEKKK